MKEQSNNRDMAGGCTPTTSLTTHAEKERTMADSEHTTTFGKSPAFQFYPKDFLTDENVRVMSMQERGVYITLMSFCWIEGTLPADTKRLARLCGMPAQQFNKLWKAIAPCFEVNPLNAERIIHPRLNKERVKQIIFRRRQSDKGRASSAARRQPDTAPDTNRGSTAVQPAAAKPPEPDTNSSVCSLHLQSSDSSQKNTRASEPFDSFQSSKPGNSERAGDFVERYKRLHVRLRKGAHYLGKPTFDFQEALQLVAVYDDARLDKLAYVWLNTDHEFATNGTRTIAKFRSMVSWCEERLIDWEEAHGPLTVAS